MLSVGRDKLDGASLAFVPAEYNPSYYGRNQNRRPTNDPRYVKLATPQSSHSTAARRRVAAQEGAGGDGGIVDWKSTAVYFGCNNRKQVSGAGLSLARMPRLEQATIASSMRSAGNRMTKQQRDKAAAAVASIMTRQNIKSGERNSKPVKIDSSYERRRHQMLLASAAEKKNKPMSATAKQEARARLWSQPQRKLGGTNLKKVMRPIDNEEMKTLGNCEVEIDVFTEAKPNPIVNVVPATNLAEMGIQTNESEILDRDLLIGDVKILLPSQEIVEQIEKTRKETKAKFEKQKMRRFAFHEQDEETHLNELKEFMERNCVTKRCPNKPSVSHLQYKPSTIFKSMDELFKHEVPKSESITNIKKRIKRKEQELMNLFDNAEANNRNSNT